MSAGLEESYKGYREPCVSLMKRFGVTVWCEVKMETTRGEFEGLILPRSETADADHLVLKLESGYNIGIRYDTVDSIEKTGRIVVLDMGDAIFPFV